MNKLARVAIFLFGQACILGSGFLLVLSGADFKASGTYVVFFGALGVLLVWVSIAKWPPSDTK